MTPSEKELFRPFVLFLDGELKRYSGKARYEYLLRLRKDITGFDSLFNRNTRRRLMGLPEFGVFSKKVDDEIKKFEMNVTK
jgi:hypothetical protein